MITKLKTIVIYRRCITIIIYNHFKIKNFEITIPMYYIHTYISYTYVCAFKKAYIDEIKVVLMQRKTFI